METEDTIQSEQPTNEMEELSHSDKIIGVISEPAKTFHITSLFPVRTKDWMIPLLIVFAIAGIIRSVAMLNDDVYFEAKQQQVKMRKIWLRMVQFLKISLILHWRESILRCSLCADQLDG